MATKRPAKKSAKKPTRTPGRVPAAVRQAVWARDLGCCLYCGRSEKHMTVDHIVPQAQGGKHTASNLVTACVAHNHLRSQCPLKYWVQWCEDLGLGTAAEIAARVATALATPVKISK
jgi:hypothetical protein